MKVLFKNITKYTKENCNNFEKFHIHKYGKREIRRFIWISLLLIYIFIMNIIYKNWLFLLCAILTIIIIYFIMQFQHNETKKEKKKNKTFSFYFYENYIKVKYKHQFERLLYFKIHKVFETENYFYIYTDEKSAFILQKEGFQIGSATEFAVFMQHKLPFKYHKEQK